MNHEGGKPSRTTALLIAVACTFSAAAIFLRPRASARPAAFIMQPLSTISGLDQVHIWWFAEKSSLWDSDAMTEREFSAIGLRLAAIRTAFSGANSKDFAESHGFGVTQWHNWEAGVRRIPVDDAERLCDLYGLTLDFIYRGRRDALSQNASKVI